MARKLRLEYAGACYHVINRGNYRRHLFESKGAAATFERCLDEACTRFHWLILPMLSWRITFTSP
jgi:putative transposase